MQFRSAPRMGQFGAIVAGVLLAMHAGANAASIGVNFNGGGNGDSPGVSLMPTDSAGVVPQTNYNNIAGNSGAGVTGVVLNDGTGGSTTATLTLTGAGGTYSSIAGAGIAPVGGDEKLNTGFVYGSSVVTVAGVPYTNYDVYVYTLNDAGGRVQTTSLTGGPTVFGAAANPSDSGHVDQNGGTAYVYTQTTSTDVGSPTAGGDYVRFSGLSGPTFSFNVSAPGNGYLNGFQIVEAVPEPASLGLGALASAGLLLRRRRA